MRMDLICSAPRTLSVYRLKIHRTESWVAAPKASFGMAERDGRNFGCDEVAYLFKAGKTRCFVGRRTGVFQDGIDLGLRCDRPGAARTEQRVQRAVRILAIARGGSDRKSGAIVVAVLDRLQEGRRIDLADLHRKPTSCNSCFIAAGTRRSKDAPMVNWNFGSTPTNVSRLAS